MKKWSILLVLLMIVSIISVGCGSSTTQPEDEPTPQEPIQKSELILATTTSTYDSGLLDYLLPYFEEEHNFTIKVVSLGTGQALELAKNGDADIVLVHAKATELEMVEQGHFVDRYDVMYNDFVIVGPDADPAGVKGMSNVNDAFNAISEDQVPFVSRGDDSGTHKKEKSLWEATGISPEGDWYVSAGAGMGDTLRMADEMEGYAITDRATYLSMKDKLDSVIVFEGDNNLFNQYGVMAVNPVNYPEIKYEGATQFIEFMTSDEGQQLISNYKPYGDTLFFPNAE
jgi:tungstate transport system substrate-binding protein